MGIARLIRNKAIVVLALVFYYAIATPLIPSFLQMITEFTNLYGSYLVINATRLEYSRICENTECYVTYTPVPHVIDLRFVFVLIINIVVYLIPLFIVLEFLRR